MTTLTNGTDRVTFQPDGSDWVMTNNADKVGVWMNEATKNFRIANLVRGGWKTVG